MLDEDDDEAGDVMLDPPDPLDLLIAHTENNVIQKPKPLDFVRAKFQDMKKENKRLKARVADLEQTLSIVQTAQEWSGGKGTSQEQLERQQKMREIKALLEQAKKAREELQNFSGASRQALYEKLRASKAALRKEKEEKQEMKDRLLHAFDHARAIKEQLRQVSQQRQAEQERWQETVRDMKERHRRELRRLQGEGAVTEADRHDQFSHFGEQALDGLMALQQHIRQVRGLTVDAVIMEEAADATGGLGDYGYGSGDPWSTGGGGDMGDGVSDGEDDAF